MRLESKKKGNTKQQQKQKKGFVSYQKIKDLLHVLRYFTNTLLYLAMFLSTIPVPLTTALKGSSAI